MKRIAIITARGGSKRIPRKNIKLFAGKPIIQYSIEAALHSRLFDEVMVSTDDLEISSISQSLGAAVPFLRSDKTSNDFAGTADVLIEVIDMYRNKLSKSFESVCCIYPTAPFLTSSSIKKSYDIFQEKEASSVISVSKYSAHIQRSLKLEAEGQMRFNYPNQMNKRSQDLEENYYDVGQLYWLKTLDFMNKKALFMNKTYPFVIDELYTQDINTIEDWKICEMKYKALNLL